MGNNNFTTNINYLENLYDPDSFPPDLELAKKHGVFIIS